MILSKKSVENINKSLELSIINSIFKETKDAYKNTFKEFNENINKEIFLTKCDCGKRIAVLVERQYFNHGAYTCNDCIPKNYGLRNGIDESRETDLFDEFNI